jgi:hypothetical protein
MDTSWDLPLDLEIGPPPVGGGSGGRGGRVARPKGVVARSSETRDGVEFQVETLAPESFPRTKRGKGRVGKYATPKPRTVEGAGSGSGLWTGTNIDRTLLNSCRRDTVRAARWAKEFGSLVDAPWEVIGKRALFRAVRAARDFEAENCPAWEVQHVLDDWDMDLSELLEGRDGP